MRLPKLLTLMLLPLCALCPLWLHSSAFALDADEIEFRQALKDMSNDLRLLCVAAHPDDEDGATLAYHRYKYGIKTFALIGTRGEGGQNEIGPELYEELAVIRTKEMMEAAKIEGAELHFLDMPDFGFSKTIEETFEKWGKEVLLEKMVRKIREIRPHVIITHHGRMKDHGHHQAMGWAVQEAFDKAADKAYLPDGGEPWQVQRLYIRDFMGESKEAVAVDISEKDELREKTYAEIAADALRAHKSQGMEIFIERLLSPGAKAYYDLVKGKIEVPVAASLAPPDEDLFGQLFQGMPLLIDHAALAFAEDTRSRTELADGLLKLYKANAAQINAPTSLYIPALLFALKLATNTWYVVQWDDSVVTKGQDWCYSKLATDTHKSTSRVNLSWVGVGSPPYPYPREMQLWERTRVPPEIARNAELQVMSNGQIFNWGEHPWVGLTIPHARHLRDPAMFKHSWTSGEVGLITDINAFSWPSVLLDFFDVAPPVLPEFIAAPYLIRHTDPRALEVRVRLTNYTPGPHAQEVSFTAPEAWDVEPAVLQASFTAEDEVQTVTLQVRPPADVAAGSYTLTAETVGLDFTPEAKVAVVDVELPGLFKDNVTTISLPGGKDARLPLITDPMTARKVGIIGSYDTALRDVCAKLGLEHELVETATPIGEFIGHANQCTTIIIDMRAYGKRPDLREHNAALLEWCKAGGTLIVMYHKTQDWSSDFAPYPIILSNNRVTREDAPVKMLVPEHPWFNTPNKITPEDWDGWRQERGLYFPQQWDDAYTPLIETTDPGEHIPPGSCLIAKYGEGTYFYTSLVWYRQLRELHPGALKLFANMLAL